MAQKLEKLQLISELDRSRIVLKEDFGATRDGLNAPARLRSSVLDAPVSWLTGAAVAGMVAGALLRGSRKARWKAKEAKIHAKLAKQSLPTVPPPRGPSGSFLAGLPVELLKLTFHATKPLLLAYATSKAAEVATEMKVRDKLRRKK